MNNFAKALESLETAVGALRDELSEASRKYKARKVLVKRLAAADRPAGLKQYSLKDDKVLEARYKEMGAAYARFAPAFDWHQCFTRGLKQLRAVKSQIVVVDTDTDVSYILIDGGLESFNPRVKGEAQTVRYSWGNPAVPPLPQNYHWRYGGQNHWPR